MFCSTGNRDECMRWGGATYDKKGRLAKISHEGDEGGARKVTSKKIKNKKSVQ